MPPRSALRWSEKSGRYRDARGRFVNAAAVRADLDRALDLSAKNMARLSDQLRAREIGLIEWELAMRKEVKMVQLYSAASAKGGLAQLSQADLGRVGAAVKRDYQRLASFAQAIEDGLPLDGRFTQRARMYAGSGRGLYHRTERGEMERRGYDREANILAARDNCALCLSETARGLVPIGDLIPIGSRTCLTNCRCRIRYVNSRAGVTAA